MTSERACSTPTVLWLVNRCMSSWLFGKADKIAPRRTRGGTEHALHRCADIAGETAPSKAVDMDAQ